MKNFSVISKEQREVYICIYANTENESDYFYLANLNNKQIKLVDGKELRDKYRFINLVDNKYRQQIFKRLIWHK